MSLTRMIEVFEWKNSATRPGSGRKARGDCLTTLALPPEWPSPQKGDVVTLRAPEHAHADERGFVHFVVLERELLWGSDDEPQKWHKMWIHVRALNDYEQLAIVEPDGFLPRKPARVIELSRSEIDRLHRGEHVDVVPGPVLVRPESVAPEKDKPEEDLREKDTPEKP